MNQSTFCPIPWLFQAVRNNGDIRICCQANVTENQGVIRHSDGTPFNASRDNLQDARNADLMKSVRKNMLQNRWSSECGRCKQEEESGLNSRRQYEQQNWPRFTLDKAKAQIQNNNLQISQAIENSNTLNDSIGEVERLLKKNEVQSSSSPALGHEHIVESGHTLSVIAQAYGSTVEAIKRTNNLNNDVIYVGQKLFIPE